MINILIRNFFILKKSNFNHHHNSIQTLFNPSPSHPKLNSLYFQPHIFQNIFNVNKTMKIK